MSLEQAIEEIIDRYMRDYDFGDLTSDITKAAVEEVQGELNDMEDFERRIKYLEDTIEKLYQALKPE